MQVLSIPKLGAVTPTPLSMRRYRLSGRADGKYADETKKGVTLALPLCIGAIGLTHRPRLHRWIFPGTVVINAVA